MKKIVFDMLLNISATAVPVFVLQIILLPMLSKDYMSEDYGVIITTLSLINTVPSALGNVLNNIRLLYDKRYNGGDKDFQLLLFVFQFLNVLTISYLGFGICNDNFELFLLLIICVLFLIREYYIVSFRLIINYVAILVNNLLLVLGYGIGYFIYLYCGYWQFIYMIGLICAVIHILFRSVIMNEKLCKTEMFSEIFLNTCYLLLATIIARISIFADKLLIFCFYGSTNVTVYYVATLASKILTIVINPINSVALTYITKLKSKPDYIFKYTLINSSILCVCCYFIIQWLGVYLLDFLYPEYRVEAMKYIRITTATIMLEVLVSIVTPFVLRFFDIKIQMYINLTGLLFLVGINVLLAESLGLFGFCLSAFAANFIKLGMLMFVYIFAKSEVHVI